MIIKIIGKIRRIFFHIYNTCFYKKMGLDSVVENPLFITNKKCISIGDNVFIRDFARIEAVKIYGKQIFSPNLIVEDNVICEQGCHFVCANLLKIGRNSLISSYCFITDCNHIYSDVSIPVINQPLEVKETILEEQCFLGSGSKIMAGVHLGKHCVVGANSVVTKSFPDFCVLVGVPAKCIKRYDSISKSWKKTDANGDFFKFNCGEEK